MTPRVAYFFTRFPHLTETFLQREVRALARLGLEPALHSLHGGGPDFDGRPVRCFPKWALFALLWRLPREWLRAPAEVAAFARRLFLAWPRDWMNHWENLYGAGIAVVLAGRVRREGFTHLHAVWASLPAMTAWVLSRLTGSPFSIGAHAYDLFEHGGDWFLREKCRDAAFVHTSTEAGRRRLVALGVPAGRIVLARRGLDEFPPCRPLRPLRDPLRVLCVARLVEKKGLLRQIALHARMRAAGLEFTVRILGDGPLRSRIESAIREASLEDRITLTGAVPHARVLEELAAADVLVHSGVVTSSGDRDGLPNVVPEAMAAGVLVVTAPGSGVSEAIEDGVTGFVADLDDPAAWSHAFRRIQAGGATIEAVRVAARAWVEENFDAVRNAALLRARFDGARAEIVPAAETEGSDAVL